MAAQLHRKRPQPARQPEAAAAVPFGRSANLLDERPAGADLSVAEVPEHPEPDHNTARSQRSLVQGALVRTVHAACPLPAVRARVRPTGGYRLHHQGVGGVPDAFHPHIDPGKEHILNRLARIGRKRPAETIPRSRGWPGDSQNSGQSLENGQGCSSSPDGLLFKEWEIG